MYLDKLDGRISEGLFDKKSAEWRGEQQRLLTKIQEIQMAAPVPVEQAIDMLQLTSRASELFLEQPAKEQQHLLQVMIKEATWQDGSLRTTLFEPFQILRHSNQASARKENVNPGSGQELEVWLLW
jgi:thioredoxin-like negative regulator of GroEL